MFTADFTLRQHTPLIHFLHNQKDATLRATELKPRFDIFLQKELSILKSDLYNQYKEVINEPYQVTIFAEKEREYWIASQLTKEQKATFDRKKINFLSPSPYFADNEAIKKGKIEIEPEKAKKGIMYKNIKVSFFCFNQDKIKLIQQSFATFLALYNFGSRQSKGFGSFTIDQMKRNEFEDILLDKYGERVVFSTDASESDLALIFDIIQKEYQILKSGSPQKKNIKSQLALYYSKQQIQFGDRDKVKDDLINSSSSKLNKDYTQHNYQFIRIVLGLAELYEYPKTEKKVHIKCNDSNKNIERFQSPITFKVFDKTIYLLPNKIPEEVFNTTFEFSISNDKWIKLQTPRKFDLNKFLSSHLHNDWAYL